MTNYQTTQTSEYDNNDINLEREGNFNFNPKPKRSWRWLWYILAAVIFFAICALTFVYVNLQAPRDFPVNEPIEIEQGSTVRDIVNQLHSEGVIKSTFIFYTLFVLRFDPTDLKASTYVFDRPLNASEVAERLTLGDFVSNLIRLTHREGESVQKLAEAIPDSLTQLDKAEFVRLATPKEGRLFPDTYFIPPTFTATQLVEVMEKRFNDAIADIEAEIAASPLSLEDIIITASIIEREANDRESMRMVSGIIKNRLEINMPLQLDASIEYELNKPLSELTAEDLRQDSPYNTYTNYGLTPTAIGNPGLEAILAVLNPTDSDYLYYITGNDGIFYYAEDFDQHRLNISRHLR